MKTAYAELRERAFEANREIVSAGLVVLTFGNASALDRDAGVMAIKPSGVGYDELSPDSIVVVDLESGAVVEGTHRPSSDTPTHLVLYRALRGRGGHRPHPLPVRHGLGPGVPGDPLLRHHPRGPLPRARAGHARAHRRGDRRRLRGEHGRRDRRDARRARSRAARDAGGAGRVARAVRVGCRRRRGGRERGRPRGRRRRRAPDRAAACRAPGRSPTSCSCGTSRASTVPRPTTARHDTPA